ncbi:MAG: hypothetical protein ACJ76R_03320 [Solirubrobacteraceae bacterium]
MLGVLRASAVAGALAALALASAARADDAQPGAIGSPFTRTDALGQDAGEHGADGSLDVTGNLLRDGLPFGTHDTHGWPTFAGWPTHDTMTHQQSYYVWLQRAWLAGERLIVAQTVEDEPICRVEPVRSHTCSEPAAIRQRRPGRPPPGGVQAPGRAQPVHRALDRQRVRGRRPRGRRQGRVHQHLQPPADRPLVPDRVVPAGR